jgi:hypothetical protein
MLSQQTISHHCVIADGEIIAHMYEVPLESIKWIKIVHEDSNEVNAFHHGSHLHFKTQAELLAKQQKLEDFLKLTRERAKRVKRLHAKIKKSLLSRRNRLEIYD